MLTPDMAELIEDVRDVVFRTDETGRWTFLNGAWSILTGFSVAESLGTLSLAYVHPDDRERHRALLDPLAGGQDRGLQQLRYMRKQGGFRWVEVHARVAVEDD